MTYYILHYINDWNTGLYDGKQNVIDWHCVQKASRACKTGQIKYWQEKMELCTKAIS